MCQPIAVATGLSDLHAIAASPSGIVISAGSDVSLCASPGGCTTTALATIKAGVSQLNNVTVAGTTVFFDGNVGDNEVVYSCPVAGCPGAGPTKVDEIVNDTIGRVVAGPNDVLWTRYSYYGPYSQRCSLAGGCGAGSAVGVRAKTAVAYGSLADREQSVPSTITSAGVTSTLWATGGLYNNSTKNLRSCNLTTTCTPQDIPTEGYVTALTYFGGKHYGASGADGGGNVIFNVDDAAPAGSAILVADAAGITDVAVDASGIYWVNGTTGKVLRCATLTGCAGSGETLATGQTGAKRIALDDKFVYWATPTAVLKVAK